MQTLLRPVAPAGSFTVAPSDSTKALSGLAPHLRRLDLRPYCLSSLSLIPLKSLQPLTSSYSSSFPSCSVGALYGSAKLSFSAKAYSQGSPPSTPPDDKSEEAKLAQVSKRLEKTARYFKRLGSLGFWGQLVCTVVAAVILSFSVVIQLIFWWGLIYSQDSANTILSHFLGLVFSVELLRSVTLPASEAIPTPKLG